MLHGFLYQGKIKSTLFPESMKDFNNKYRLYESQKVNYYIIINPETKECNLFELQKDVYVQNDNLKDFSFHADCKIVFDIPAYVAQLNLD